jgi:hypothetical protein
MQHETVSPPLPQRSSSSIKTALLAVAVGGFAIYLAVASLPSAADHPGPCASEVGTARDNNGSRAESLHAPSRLPAAAVDAATDRDVAIAR